MRTTPISVNRPRIFSPDQLARMYPAAVRMLSEIGLRVRHADVLEAAQRAGIRVVGDRVFPERSAMSDLVVETGPPAGQEAPRAESDSPDITLTIHNYATQYHDPATDEVVPYTTESIIEATKLVDTCAGRGLQSGAPGMPTDVPPLLRTVKQFQVGAQYSRTGREYWDAQYRWSLAYVLDMAEVVGHPIDCLPVFVNSPLCIAGESVSAVMAYRDRLKSIRVSNISSAGVSAPIKLADALTVGLAEVLGTAAVMREVTGLPAIWNVTVTGGSPSSALERWGSGELTAFYHGRHPWPPSGTILTGAKRPGSQAAAEKMCYLAWGAMMGSRSFLGAGNLCGEETWSPEQLMLDLEMRDYVQHVIRGTETDFDPETCLAEAAEGVEEGFFLGMESTARRYRHVTWLPKLFDQPDERQRAREMVSELLAGYDYAFDSELARELERIYAKAERDHAAM